MRFAPLKSATLAIAATGFQRFVVIVAFVWLSRRLSRDDFGAFSFLYAGAVAYATVVLMPASQVFGAAIGRHPRTAAVANFYLATTTLLALVAALAYAGFVGLAGGDYAHFDASTIAIAVVLTVALVVGGMLNATTFAAGRRRAAARATVIGNLAGLAALAWVVPVPGVAGSLAVFLLIVLLGAAVVLPSYPGTSDWRAWPEGTTRRRELRQLLPLVAGGCLGAPVHALCLSFLLHGSAGLHDVALFNVAFQFYGVMIFVPGVLSVALMPFLRPSAGTPPDAAKVGLHTSLLVNLMIGVIPLLIFAAASEWLVVTVFGAAYREAAPSVVALSLAGLVFGISTALQQWLIAHARGHEVVYHGITYSLAYVLSAWFALRQGLGHFGLSLALLGASVTQVATLALHVRAAAGPVARVE